MELANLWASTRGNPSGVRLATDEDIPAITRLLQTAVYRHLHVDWQLPVDWLGSPGFVVLPEPNSGEKNSFTGKMFPNHNTLAGCLIATADPPPAAWVRATAVALANGAEERLQLLLAQVLPSLHQQGVTQLAWLTVESWPRPWLPKLGFYRAAEIETYVKKGNQLPARPPVRGLAIEQVQPGDLEALAKLETDALEPIWRYSAQTLGLAIKEALTFDVAWLGNEIVGYQLSVVVGASAHLVRLVVHPEKQSLGIGSALLEHAVAGYLRRGLGKISLNTQVENTVSHRLYQKYGFEPSGKRYPVWIADISRPDRGE